MAGGTHPVGARLGRTLIAALIAAAALLLVASINPAESPAKGKKIRACVVKKGPEKGTMMFSRKGKCPKGHKKISWNKKGKRGKQGPPGQTGAAGPQGPSGVTDQLLATIASQQTKIDELTTQVNGLTSQLDGLTPQVAALCSQMDGVTDQVDTLGTVFNGLGVGGLPGLLITFATPVPAALGGFACP